MCILFFAEKLFNNWKRDNENISIKFLHLLGAMKQIRLSTLFSFCRQMHMKGYHTIFLLPSVLLNIYVQVKVKLPQHSLDYNAKRVSDHYTRICI